MHLSRSTVCPPLCTEGTKLQGISSSLRICLETGTDLAGLGVQRVVDPPLPAFGFGKL